MSLFKIKTPVEYSFIQLMNNFPDTGHWRDKEYFYAFVKTVCRFNAVKWKNILFFKNKILKVHPNVDPDCLDYLLTIYYELLHFYKVPPVTCQYQSFDRNVKHGHYLEIQVINGAVSEKELPVKSFTFVEQDEVCDQ